jgi:hypothetical protein
LIKEVAMLGPTERRGIPVWRALLLLVAAQQAAAAVQASGSKVQVLVECGALKR